VYDLAADSWTNRSMPVRRPRTRVGVLAHISTRDDEVLVMFGGNTDPAVGSTGISRTSPVPRSRRASRLTRKGNSGA
jgi:hypothetical protein